MKKAFLALALLLTATHALAAENIKGENVIFQKDNRLQSFVILTNKDFVEMFVKYFPDGIMAGDVTSIPYCAKEDAEKNYITYSIGKCTE